MSERAAVTKNPKSREAEHQRTQRRSLKARLVIVGICLLAKVIVKVSQAIGPLYEKRFGKLKAERILNIDETGHRDSGKRMWTWCFRGSDFTVFKIDPSRGSGVLLDVLGEEFNGIIGCDYVSAYHKYRGLTDCKFSSVSRT